MRYPRSALLLAAISACSPGCAQTSDDPRNLTRMSVAEAKSVIIGHDFYVGNPSDRQIVSQTFGNDGIYYSSGAIAPVAAPYLIDDRGLCIGPECRILFKNAIGDFYYLIADDPEKDFIRFTTVVERPTK